MSKNVNQPKGLSTTQKIVAGASTLVLATSAQAAVTAPDFTGPMADVAIVLGAMLGFGAVVWGARKLVNFVS